MLNVNSSKTIVLLLDSSTIGGIESHVLQLAKQLKNRSFNTQVVFLKNHSDHPLYQLLEQAHINYHLLNGRFQDLSHYLKQHQPYLLHTHGYKASIFGKLAARLNSIPIVSSYHAGEPGSGLVRLYNILDKMMAYLSDNIAVSQPILQQLPKHRSTQIANFIEIPNVAIHSTARSTPPQCVFVGRLSEEKGPDRFCQLAQLLSQQASFHVYGDGPMAAQLQQQYHDQVNFHGQVDSMDNYWSDASLLCITSRHEGLPLVALEAMARGIPVVSFDVGSLKQVIEHQHNGYMIESQQIKSFADYVQVYLNLSTEDKSQLSHHARQTIITHYSPEKIMPEILAVYDTARKRLAT